MFITFFHPNWNSLNVLKRINVASLIIFRGIDFSPTISWLKMVLHCCDWAKWNLEKFSHSISIHELSFSLKQFVISIHHQSQLKCTFTHGHFARISQAFNQQSPPAPYSPTIGSLRLTVLVVSSLYSCINSSTWINIPFAAIDMHFTGDMHIECWSQKHT